MTVIDFHLDSRPVAPAEPTIPALLPVGGADLRVPLAADGSLVRYVNFDYAASAPALDSVTARLAQVSPYYSSVHRGAGWASQVSTALYEGARAAVARFVGAGPDDVVVFTRNTTDALNLLATAVPHGRGDVVVLELEHHANLLAWQGGATRIVGVRETLAETLTALEAELAAAPAALVSVTGASNVTGELLPVRQLARIVHAHGARLCVDAAQLAPHRRVAMAEAGIDYLALSGHKLYAPYGAGVLVGRRDWLDEADPYLAGGGAVRSVSTESVDWAPAPARHEAGTPNVLGAVAVAAACEALSELPIEALETHEAALRQRLVAGLAQIEGLHIVRIWADSPATIGVVTFVLDGYDPGLLAAVLSAEYGIGVRDGKFCAHPLLARLGLGHGAVRASLGVGSSSADVDRLVAALAEIADRGPRLSYHLVDGRFAPVHDARRLPEWLDPTVVVPVGSSPCQQA